MSKLLNGRKRGRSLVSQLMWERWRVSVTFLTAVTKYLTRKSNLKKKGLNFDSSSGGLPSVMVGKAWPWERVPAGHMTPIIREQRESWFRLYWPLHPPSPCVLLCLSPAHGMVPSSFRMGLLMSLKPLWEQRHGQALGGFLG